MPGVAKFINKMFFEESAELKDFAFYFINKEEEKRVLAENVFSSLLVKEGFLYDMSFFMIPEKYGDNVPKKNRLYSARSNVRFHFDCFGEFLKEGSEPKALIYLPHIYFICSIYRMIQIYGRDVYVQYNLTHDEIKELHLSKEIKYGKDGYVSDVLQEIGFTLLRARLGSFYAILDNTIFNKRVKNKYEKIYDNLKSIGLIERVD
jgi:hypothetical protein